MTNARAAILGLGKARAPLQFTRRVAKEYKWNGWNDTTHGTTGSEEGSKIKAFVDVLLASSSQVGNSFIEAIGVSLKPSIMIT